MSIRQGHSEFNPTGSSEHPSLWGTLINKGLVHLFRYEQLFLVKALSLYLLTNVITDLSIRVPMVYTKPMFSLLRAASLLQATRRRATVQGRPHQPITSGVELKIFGINNDTP